MTVGIFTNIEIINAAVALQMEAGDRENIHYRQRQRERERKREHIANY